MNFYLLYKSLHLISVISWMAGLLYLPRIFVYHSELKNSTEQSQTFKTMERKLFFFIMNPAMILSWIFGLLLIYSIGLESLTSLWMQIKLISVIILTIWLDLIQIIMNILQNFIGLLMRCLQFC